jgi:hypothetical protein
MTTTKTTIATTTKTAAKPATRKRTTTPKPKVDNTKLPNNPFVFEVLGLVNTQTTDVEKVKVLKEYEHPSLKSIFIWNFDKNVVSMIPEGEVPYSTAGEDLVKSGSMSERIEKEVEKMESYDNSSISYTEKIRAGHTSLRTEYESLINFVKSVDGTPGNPGLPSLRRESMFIQLLEGLHPLDAEILCLVKDKKLTNKYKITREIISEAYPDIIWERR